MWSTITDCFSETYSGERGGSGELPSLPPPQPRLDPSRVMPSRVVPCRRSALSLRVRARARARVSTYRLMTRARAWRMIIKVSQVSRFVSTLSRFLSSFLPRQRAGRVMRARPSACSRLHGDDLFAVIKDTVPPHDSIDHPSPPRCAFLFHSILYCHDNARLRLFVRLSRCVSRRRRRD